jgi:hypothetical protein
VQVLALVFAVYYITTEYLDTLLFMLSRFDKLRHGSTTEIANPIEFGANQRIVDYNDLQVTLSGTIGQLRQITNKPSGLSCPVVQKVCFLWFVIYFDFIYLFFS